MNKKQKSKMERIEIPTLLRRREYNGSMKHSFEFISYQDQKPNWRNWKRLE